MASDKSIWYQMGHALERARHTAPPPRPVETSGGEGEGSDSLTVPRPEIPSSEELMTAGIALVVDKALEGWTGRRQPGLTLLLRAAAAGAAAALLTDLIRPLLRGDAELPAMDPNTAGRILAGLGQGLIYGGVVEPRVPGPAVLKGAVFGSLEYAVHPMGGLTGILGSHTPQRKIPFLGDLLDGLDGDDRAYLEHLVFGIALALIYESGRSSNGMSPDGE